MARLSSKNRKRANSPAYLILAVYLNPPSFIGFAAGKTAWESPKAFLAFFLAVKDDGFNGRLPFRRVLLSVTPQPERVAPLFQHAIRLAQSDQLPPPGEACDCCRWFRDTAHFVTHKED